MLEDDWWKDRVEDRVEDRLALGVRLSVKSVCGELSSVLEGDGRANLAARLAGLSASGSWVGSAYAHNLFLCCPRSWR